MLRDVVSEKNGTASLANIYGYNVGGKTGTSENYQNKKQYEYLYFCISYEGTLNMFLVMLENPKPAPDLSL